MSETIIPDGVLRMTFKKRRSSSGGARTPGAGAAGPETVLGISGAPCPEVPALVLTGTLPFFLPRDGSTK